METVFFCITLTLFSTSATLSSQPLEIPRAQTKNVVEQVERNRGEISASSKESGTVSNARTFYAKRLQSLSENEEPEKDKPKVKWLLAAPGIGLTVFSGILLAAAPHIKEDESSQSNLRILGAMGVAVGLGLSHASTQTLTSSE